MKTAKELVQQINALNLCSPHYLDDELDMDAAGITKVATQDRDEHRWYIVGTVVFKVGTEFFGVRGPISLKSEESGYDDICMKCVAFEMQQVPAVAYIAQPSITP